MTRRQCSNQWNGGIATNPETKQFRVQKFAGNVFALIFLYQDSIFLIDYLPKSQNISTEFYVSLPMQLKDILNEICGGKFIKVVLFLHDNAPTHCALASHKKLAKLFFQNLDHPPYSPDLAPSDCRLFPGLKKVLKCFNFSYDVEVIAAAGTWLDGQYYEFLSGLL
jgi:histone-lysine N-methyltransferase SETMAR